MHSVYVRSSRARSLLLPLRATSHGYRPLALSAVNDGTATLARPPTTAMDHSTSSSVIVDDPIPSHSQYPSADELPTAQVRKRESLAHISVPSFSAFRAQASHIPVVSPSQRSRGDSLPSPRATSYSGTARATNFQSFGQDKIRPFSLDSPLPPQPSGLANELSPPLTEDFAPKSGDRSVLYDSKAIG